jgi:hypothetical protein
MVLCLLVFPPAFAIAGMIGAACFALPFSPPEQSRLFSYLIPWGLLSGSAAGLLLALSVYGPLGGRRPRGRRKRPGRTYPDPDASYDLLHAAGWDVEEERVATPAGLRWVVTGTLGEEVVEARGATPAEAWHRAAEQARALGMLGRSVFP